MDAAQVIPFNWWDAKLAWEVWGCSIKRHIELLKYVQGPFSDFSTKVAQIVNCTFKSCDRKGTNLSRSTDCNLGTYWMPYQKQDKGTRRMLQN